MEKMEEEGDMKNKEKACSIALTSTMIIIFLILISSTVSASIGEGLHRVPSEIASEAGGPFGDKVLSDEFSTEGNVSVAESIQVAGPNITETRITTNASRQCNPVIYGNRIVWEDWRNDDGNWTNTDIYMYDLSTSEETQITTNASDQRFPAIYGDKIVWEDDRNGNLDIYMYDLSTSKETQITTNASDQGEPDIYGDRIVWDDYRNKNYNIFMYNLSTSKETRITTNASSQGNPAIYGDRIVWEDWRNNIPSDRIRNTDIYMYNLSTKKETQITTNPSGQWNPVTYGDKIVWEDNRNGEPDEYGIPDSVEIYMYDLSTSKETQIYTYPSDQAHPSIYGNRIVWEDWRDGNSAIYVYDLVTDQISHTTSESYQVDPAIYSNKIVWADYRNGNPDIYMGTLSTSPIASFSAFPTSGKAPLNVSFTDKSTGTPTAWKWDFGDGATSTEQNPMHTFSVAGTYTVNLTAINSEGADSNISVINVTNPSLVGPYAYITNDNDYHGTVTVIDTSKDTVIATVDVGLSAFGVAVNPAGTKAYVGNWGSGTVSVIDIATNTVTATVNNVGWQPWGVAVNPAGTKVYVANTGGGTVSVIDTATNTVTATVPVGSYPYGVAVNPDGTKVYVANGNSKTVSVIDAATNTVTATVPVGSIPYGVVVNPMGTKVYVTNEEDKTVSVIDITTNTVTGTLPVDSNPWAIAVNPAGTKVYVVSNNVTSVIDTATNTVTAKVPVGGPRSGVSFTPDGKKVYVVGNGTATVIDAATNTVTTTISNVGSIPVAFGQFIVPPKSPEPILPVSKFIAKPTSGKAPLTVAFTDKSTGSPTKWKWTFGDGTNSTLQNPKHTYSKEGNYTVNLTVTNDAGSNTSARGSYIKVTTNTRPGPYSNKQTVN